MDESAIVESEEVQSRIALDYDKDARLVGVEILSLMIAVMPYMTKHFEYGAARKRFLRK